MSRLHPETGLVRRWLAASAHQIAQGRDFTYGGIDTAQRHLLRRTEGRCALSVQDPSRFGAFGSGEVRLAQTTIRFVTCDAATEIRKSTHRSADRAHIILQCVLSGGMDVIKGGRHVQVTAGQALISGSVGETVKRWRGACALLNIVMPEEALARILASECAPEDRALVRLGQMEVLELGSVAALAHFVGAVVSDLCERRPAFDRPQAASHAEHALHLLALKSFALSGDEGAGESAAAATPFYVRRAESHMRDNLRTPLTLLGLAEVTGVSPRTLQYGFKLHRNATPMEVLRRIRLSAARDALIESRATGRKVGEVAALCGYVSQSHFSRDYRAHFGESPSDTVRAG